MPVERFVVLTLPRSGSHHLCGLLDSHPEVLCHQEIFNPDHVWYSPCFSHKDDPVWTDRAARDADRVAFLEKIWQAREGSSTVGFKLFLFDHPSVLDAVVDNRSVEVILLWRRNLLRAWTSWEVACRNEVWNSTERAKLDRKPRIVLDFDLQGFLAYKHKQEKMRLEMCRRLDRADRRFFDVTYEDLTRGDAIDEVTAFLGLAPSAPLSSHYLKIGGACLADSYRSIEPIHAALASSSMAWMLEDEPRDG